MRLIDIIEYEVKTCSSLMSLVYLYFPQLLMMKCKRKLKRLETYSEFSALDQAMKIINNTIKQKQ